MAIVDDNVMFQPDYLAKRMAVNPLNVSKKADKPKFFETEFPYLDWVLKQARKPRTETEVLKEMLILAIPPGVMREFFCN